MILRNMRLTCSKKKRFTLLFLNIFKINQILMISFLLLLFLKKIYFFLLSLLYHLYFFTESKKDLVKKICIKKHL